MLQHCQLLGGCSIELPVCDFPGSWEPLSSCLGHLPLFVAYVNRMTKGRESIAWVSLVLLIPARCCKSEQYPWHSSICWETPSRHNQAITGWVPRWPRASIGPSPLNRVTLSRFSVITAEDLYLWYWNQGDCVSTSVNLSAQRPQLDTDVINKCYGFAPSS